MRNLCNIPVLAAITFAGLFLAGCEMNWPKPDLRSRDERCMIYPSEAPGDEVFVAIRGDGTILVGDPDAELEHPADTRPIRSVVARVMIPAGGGAPMEPDGSDVPGQVLEPSTQPGP
jgi:hypothetical protein